MEGYVRCACQEVPYFNVSDQLLFPKIITDVLRILSNQILNNICFLSFLVLYVHGGEMAY